MNLLKLTRLMLKLRVACTKQKVFASIVSVISNITVCSLYEVFNLCMSLIWVRQF